MESDKSELHDLERFGVTTDRLSIFREQVGITDVLQPDSRASKRKARNIGIYSRVATEEREAKWQYLFSALLINTCLLAQVVFASALTALGAGHGSHTQITILGAANTVIAAVLTFTKGQGLPNRLRQYQCSLRKIREHIEQKEREFAQLDCKLDMDVEIRQIMRLYEEVRQNDEDNDPSTYHASTNSIVKEPVLLSNQEKGMTLSSRSEPVNLSAAKREPGAEGSKGDPDRVPRKPDTEYPPLAHPEDSERWKIAHAVTDRLVSGKPATPREDHALPVENSPNESHERVEPAASRTGLLRHQHEIPEEEADVTSARPRPTHADRQQIQSADSERANIAEAVAARWCQANLGSPFV